MRAESLRVRNLSASVFSRNYLSWVSSEDEEWKWILYVWSTYVTSITKRNATQQRHIHHTIHDNHKCYFFFYIYLLFLELLVIYIKLHTGCRPSANNDDLTASRFFTNFKETITERNFFFEKKNHVLASSPKQETHNTDPYHLQESILLRTKVQLVHTPSLELLDFLFHWRPLRAKRMLSVDWRSKTTFNVANLNVVREKKKPSTKLKLLAAQPVCFICDFERRNFKTNSGL